VDLSIHPEPPPEEREAIGVALAKLLEEDESANAYGSAWRRVGITENVEAD
jgi:hypothetical protein